MKATIIGAAGFVGGYLARYLIGAGYDVTATKLPFETFNVPDVQTYNLDILDQSAVREFLEREKPDQIYHLAAQSSVAVSWIKPQLTVEVNVKGAVNLLSELQASGRNARVLLIGSGEEYGYAAAEGAPLREDGPVRPGNVYAATKVCQNMLGAIYARAYGMDVMMTRAFNHVGPGQSPQFVVSDFCRQVARIEAGLQENPMRVGNLAARRDFSDVRDVVAAYARIMQAGARGETYNVGSGQAIEIAEVLEMILKKARCPIRIETDPEKMRPSDVPLIAADTSKIRRALGWAPQIPLEETLEDCLNDWRGRVERGER